MLNLLLEKSLLNEELRNFYYFFKFIKDGL